MSKLTTAEKKWIAEVQALLGACPSKRLGFYTIGDADVFIYNHDKELAIGGAQDDNPNADFGSAVDKCKASFDTWLTFPNCVHSVAG